jgi:lipopolysaccharide export system permease protein
MSTIDRHVAGLFLGRVLAVLAGLLALLQVLDLIDGATELLETGPPSDLLVSAALRLPSIAAGILPLAVLVGAILAYARLSSGMELVSMQAAGIGLARTVRGVAPAALLLCAAQFWLSDAAAPASQRAYADWAAARPGARPAAEPVWFRSGGDLVRARPATSAGDVLADVLIVRRGADGGVERRLDAHRAVLVPGGGWRLEGVRAIDPRVPAARTAPTLPWSDGPAAEELPAILRPVEARSAADLRALADGRLSGALPPERYLTRLHALHAGAAAPGLMALLALPALRVRVRGAGAAAGPAFALLGGIGYLVGDGVLVALGSAGILPPEAAAWGAPILFLCVGALLLLGVAER